MKISRVNLIYYSPTGNSKKTLEAIARASASRASSTSTSPH